MATVAKH